MKAYLLLFLVLTGCTTVQVNYCDFTSTGEAVNCRPPEYQDRAVPRQQL